MNPVTSFLVVVCLLAGTGIAYLGNPYFALPFFIVGILIVMSLKMANAWEKYVILRLGKLQSVKGAGLFAIIPAIDSLNPAAATVMPASIDKGASGSEVARSKVAA